MELINARGKSNLVKLEYFFNPDHDFEKENILYWYSFPLNDLNMRYREENALPDTFPRINPMELRFNIPNTVFNVDVAILFQTLLYVIFLY